MNTRFSSLVTLKKNTMQKSERALQTAHANLNSAKTALELSYNILQDIEMPKRGNISEFLASKSLLDSARGVITHNQEWIEFSKKELEKAKEQLKLDMIEHEKYKYLELEEIKKKLKEIKEKESKDLDEIALIIHQKKHKDNR